jgi:hypothetical protein
VHLSKFCKCLALPGRPLSKESLRAVLRKVQLASASLCFCIMSIPVYCVPQISTGVTVGQGIARCANVCNHGHSVGSRGRAHPKVPLGIAKCQAPGAVKRVVLDWLDNHRALKVTFASSFCARSSSSRSCTATVSKQRQGQSIRANGIQIS